MRRRLFNLCSALSLLLFGAVCVLWVRSYRVEDHVTGFSANPPRRALQEYELIASRGRLYLSRVRHRHEAEAGFAMHVRQLASRPGHRTDAPSPEEWFNNRSGRLSNWDVLLDDLGFGTKSDEQAQRPLYQFYPTTRQVGGYSRDSHVVWLPHWFAALVTVAAPAWWLRRRVPRWWRSRGKYRPGCCPRCGYDLRATPDRCPECGTSAKAK